MSAADEEMEQEASLGLYKAQLTQVDQAIEMSGETADLVQLRNDMRELIALTEENLLQLKKARLLKSLEESSADMERKTDSVDSESQDNEYAAFQASVSELSSPDTQNSQNPPPHPSTSSKLTYSESQTSLSKCRENNRDNSDRVDLEDSNAADVDSSSSSSAGEEEDDDDDMSESLSHLIGTKCQAPIRNEWGGNHYGNAMIWSVDMPSEHTPSSEFKASVVFLNPTQPSMIPCSYFMDGKCRFSDDTCRRSHGQVVLVSDLRPYVEPDHSQICEGCRCLAKSTDDVWYPATVTDVCDNDQVNVRFDAGGRESTVLVEHIKPISDEDGEAADDSDEETEAHDQSGGRLEKQNKDGDDEDSDSIEDMMPGVGSRLMAKMGYIAGQGLGPSGEGRAEPVPIMLLPQGKSLDKIMELKEMAGNADLFNAMKKLEKRQKAMEKKEAMKEKRREAKSNWGVFGFLNQKLGSQAGGKNGESERLLCQLS
ncbi:Zinc finger ccch-type with g patch domain-containing protein [Plakobranchus ocellatus]|uniref:Zinc finger CCCH-type with G patch domain-containing protein n=1 Tax=Plakobranchus ocellatus TaxID=259542 RepID=A0AAV4BAD7_9GAST|nr:Zinc finger ccch-type with g patch domain-containing protein [Plakobranchus ocellatus]